MLQNFKLFETDKKCIWNSVAIGLDCFNNGLPVVYRFFAIHCRFWEIFLWLFSTKDLLQFLVNRTQFFYWNKSTMKLSYSGFYRADRKMANKEEKNSTHILTNMHFGEHFGFIDFGVCIKNEPELKSCVHCPRKKIVVNETEHFFMVIPKLTEDNTNNKTLFNLIRV